MALSSRPLDTRKECRNPEFGDGQRARTDGHTGKCRPVPGNLSHHPEYITLWCSNRREPSVEEFLREQKDRQGIGLDRNLQYGARIGKAFGDPSHLTYPQLT